MDSANETRGLPFLDAVLAGLERGGAFELDPHTVSWLGDLVAASVNLDEMSGRPTEAQLAEVPAEMREALEGFWAAVDRMKGWRPNAAGPAAKPKLRILDVHGEPISAHPERRKLAIH